MKFSFNPSQFASIPFQIFFMLATTVILILMLYKPIVEFYPITNYPRLNMVTKNVTEKWGKEPVKINTGFVLLNFLKFDGIKNEFLISAMIWFDYDPNQQSLDTISKFSFTKGDITFKSEPYIIKSKRHLHRAIYNIRVQFSTIFDFVRFPLDDHRMFLNLINTHVEPHDVIYEVLPENFIIEDNVYISGWDVVGHKVSSGYVNVKYGPNQTIQYPKIIFAIDISKKDVRQLLLILLPLLLIFYFSIFALAIADIVLSVTVIVATVSALIAYSFVMQTLSPPVSYFMMSDYFFLSFLCCMFIIFLIILLTSPEHMLPKRKVELIKGITIPVVYSLLLITWFYLIYIKDYHI